MRRLWFLEMQVIALIVSLSLVSAAWADVFGSGEHSLTIDFVTISGSTNPTSGYGVVNKDYRIGKFEVTNEQWDSFKANLGVPVTGSPPEVYDLDSTWTGANIPISNTSWYEAAQFINWLNTSTGHHAAYKFTGTQGTADYTLGTWSAGEAENGTNLYRHKDAMYYLPTEDEWVKAAYWNGTAIQPYATRPGDMLFQGNGTNGGWNYCFNGDEGPAGPGVGPWAVGSGSKELNGTYDMMGNLWELMENPFTSGDYGVGAYRVRRGGSYFQAWDSAVGSLSSSNRYIYYPWDEYGHFGIRVASEVPEPATLGLLLLTGVCALRLKRK